TSLEIANNESVVIPEGTVITMDSGDSYDFKALYETYPSGVTIPDGEVLEWSVTNGIGRIDRYGRFLAGKLGAGEVVVKRGEDGVEDRVTVQVMGAAEPATILIEPEEDLLLG